MNKNPSQSKWKKHSLLVLGEAGAIKYTKDKDLHFITIAQTIEEVFQ